MQVCHSLRCKLVGILTTAIEVAEDVSKKAMQFINLLTLRMLQDTMILNINTFW